MWAGSITNGLLLFESSSDFQHIYLFDYYRHEFWRVRQPPQDNADSKILIACRNHPYGPIRVVEFEIP